MQAPDEGFSNDGHPNRPAKAAQARSIKTIAIAVRRMVSGGFASSGINQSKSMI
jgi:hypothetical protein